MDSSDMASDMASDMTSPNESTSAIMLDDAEVMPGDATVTPVKSPRTRIELTIEDKVKVIERSWMGLSERQIANEFGISKTAVHTAIKREQSILEEYIAGGGSRKRKSRSTYASVDDEVWGWYRDLASRNIPVPGAMIQRKAREIASEKQMMDFKGSNGWLDSFKRRHNINEFRPSGVSQFPRTIPAIDTQTLQEVLKMPLPETTSSPMIEKGEGLQADMTENSDEGELAMTPGMIIGAATNPELFQSLLEKRKNRKKKPPKKKKREEVPEPEHRSRPHLLGRPFWTNLLNCRQSFGDMMPIMGVTDAVQASAMMTAARLTPDLPASSPSSSKAAPERRGITTSRKTACELSVAEELAAMATRHEGGPRRSVIGEDLTATVRSFCLDNVPYQEHMQIKGELCIIYDDQTATATFDDLFQRSPHPVNSELFVESDGSTDAPAVSRLTHEEPEHDAMREVGEAESNNSDEIEATLVRSGRRRVVPQRLIAEEVSPPRARGKRKSMTPAQKKQFPDIDIKREVTSTTTSSSASPALSPSSSKSQTPSKSSSAARPASKSNTEKGKRKRSSSTSDVNDYPNLAASLYKHLIANEPIPSDDSDDRMSPVSGGSNPPTPSQHNVLHDVTISIPVGGEFELSAESQSSNVNNIVSNDNVASNVTIEADSGQVESVGFSLQPMHTDAGSLSTQTRQIGKTEVTAPVVVQKEQVMMNPEVAAGITEGLEEALERQQKINEAIQHIKLQQQYSQNMMDNGIPVTSLTETTVVGSSQHTGSDAVNVSSGPVQLPSMSQTVQWVLASHANRDTQQAMLRHLMPTNGEPPSKKPRLTTGSASPPASTPLQLSSASVAQISSVAQAVATSTGAAAQPTYVIQQALQQPAGSQIKTLPPLTGAIPASWLTSILAQNALQSSAAMSTTLPTSALSSSQSGTLSQPIILSPSLMKTSTAAANAPAISLQQLTPQLSAQLSQQMAPVKVETVAGDKVIVEGQPTVVASIPAPVSSVQSLLPAAQQVTYSTLPLTNLNQQLTAFLTNQSSLSNIGLNVSVTPGGDLIPTGGASVPQIVDGAVCDNQNRTQTVQVKDEPSAILKHLKQEVAGVQPNVQPSAVKPLVLDGVSVASLSSPALQQQLSTPTLLAQQPKVITEPVRIMTPVSVAQHQVAQPMRVGTPSPTQSPVTPLTAPTGHISQVGSTSNVIFTPGYSLAHQVSTASPSLTTAVSQLGTVQALPDYITQTIATQLQQSAGSPASKSDPPPPPLTKIVQHLVSDSSQLSSMSPLPSVISVQQPPQHQQQQQPQQLSHSLAAQLQQIVSSLKASSQSQPPASAASQTSVVSNMSIAGLPVGQPVMVPTSKITQISSHLSVPSTQTVVSAAPVTQKPAESNGQPISIIGKPDDYTQSQKMLELALAAMMPKQTSTSSMQPVSALSQLSQKTLQPGQVSTLPAVPIATTHQLSIPAEGTALKLGFASKQLAEVINVIPNQSVLSATPDQPQVVPTSRPLIQALPVATATHSITNTLSVSNISQPVTTTATPKWVSPPTTATAHLPAVTLVEPQSQPGLAELLAIADISQKQQQKQQQQKQQQQSRLLLPQKQGLQPKSDIHGKTVEAPSSSS